MELRHRLDNFRQHLDRLQSSFELLVDPPAVAAPESPKRPRSRRKKLQSCVRLDHEALRAQVDAMDKLTDELRSNDKRQEQAESSFDNAVAQIAIKLRKSKMPLRPCVQRDLIEDQSDRAPQPLISPELETYYEAASTLRLMQERIGDLQTEQQEQWGRRVLMEDQGQVLDQSEDNFLRYWNDTLSIAHRDFEQARENAKSARTLCEISGIMVPAWAEINSEVQQQLDSAGLMVGEPPLLDDPEAETVSFMRATNCYKSTGKRPLEHREIWQDILTSHTTPAWRQLFSDVRKKRPYSPSRLSRLCLPLIAAAMPLVTAGSNEVMDQNALPTATEPDGTHSLDNNQNVVREALSTASQYMLAISPPLILIGGGVGSIWILTREKGPFERQRFLFLMTFTASVSLWVLAATTPSGGNGGAVSISTWLAFFAIYTSRNHRGLRNGTWHLFVTLFGGLAITALFALALLTAKEDLMERFVRNCLLVGPAVVTLWSWLAARGQRQLEDSADVVADESIELQGSTDAVSR